VACRRATTSATGLTQPASRPDYQVPGSSAAPTSLASPQTTLRLAGRPWVPVLCDDQGLSLLGKMRQHLGRIGLEVGDGFDVG
jgi:hypothetical protein